MSRIPFSGRYLVVLAYLSTAAAALLLSELFLNLVLSPEITKSLWYTDGIHTQDFRFGFVFTPNYRGWMRHSDKVYLVPLKLDQYGYRNPAISAGSRQEVLAIGGRSMMFSYGMTDDHTLPHEIGASLSIPSTVYNAAWPSFHLYREFHIYRERLARRIRPDFTVIAFYQDLIEQYAKREVPEDFTHFDAPAPPHDEMFYYYEQMALNHPEDSVSQALGKLFYRSIIAHKLGMRLARVEQFCLRLLHGRSAVAVSADPNAVADGTRRFRPWTTYLQEYFGGRDKVLFVFLPGIAWSGLDMKPDQYDPLVAALPDHSNYLDLNRLFGDRVRANGYIAWGHYSAASTALLGQAIGARINQIQLSSQSQNSDHVDGSRPKTGQ
jgi:hypothetical protein